MFNIDAPLAPAIEGFVNPENDEQCHKTSLNTVVMHIHRNVNIETLIQSMGSHLTGLDEKKRARATLLLAEVLTRLPDLPLNSTSLQVLLKFFTDRLADFPSATHCLTAIIAILKHHGKNIEDPDVIFKTIGMLVTTLHIPQLNQPMRKQSFQIIQLSYLNVPNFLSYLHRQDLIHSNGIAFVQGFLNAMEGEKDPRNLLLCLKIASELMQHCEAIMKASNENALVKQYFDVVSCYFPITFTPPPHDPYGITTEELVASLRQALGASDILAPYVLPFLVKKSSATVLEAQLDAMETLLHVHKMFSINAMLLHLSDIATVLYEEVVFGDKKQVMTLAAQVITQFSKTIAHAKVQNTVYGGEYAWNTFIVALVDRSVGDLKKNSSDSLVSISTLHILTAVGEQSSIAFRYVLDKSVPVILNHLRVYFADLDNPSQTIEENDEDSEKVEVNVESQQKSQSARNSKIEGSLSHILALIDTIDRDIDLASDAQPMRPHVSEVFTTLINLLPKSFTECSSLSPYGKRLAVMALCHIVVYPPSPLLDMEQVKQLSTILTKFLLLDSDEEVRSECLKSLGSMSRVQSMQTADVYATFIMESTVSKLMACLSAYENDDGISLVLTLDSDVTTNDILHTSHRNTETYFKDTLNAITELCYQPTIFQATITQLIDSCLVEVQLDASSTFSRFPTISQNHVTIIMQSIQAIVEANANYSSSMEFCVFSNSGEDSENAIIFRLLHAMAHTVTCAYNDKTLVDENLILSCASIFATVMQNSTIEAQSIVLKETVTMFLDAENQDNYVLLQLMPLYSAIFNSTRRELDISTLLKSEYIISKLLSLAQSSIESISEPKLASKLTVSCPKEVSARAAEAAAMVLASLINKIKSEEDLSVLVSLVLEKELASVLRETGSNVVWSRRMAALDTYVWVTKALVLRGHKVHSPVCLQFLCQLISPDGQGSLQDNEAFSLAVATRFHLLLTESSNALNKKCHAHITLLHRQRTFGIIFPLLLDAIRQGYQQNSGDISSTPAVFNNVAALIALSHVILNSPKAMYGPHLSNIFPFIAAGLNTTHPELGSAAIKTFKALMFESLESVRPYLREIFPGLIKQAQNGVTAMDRNDALLCLSKLATIPYELIHPYKSMVLLQLLTCLNDHKRFVRRQAVRVRNQWSIL